MRRRIVPILALVVAGTSLSLLAVQRAPTTSGVLQSQIWTPPPRTPIADGVGRITGRVIDRTSNAAIPNVQITLGYLAPAQPGAPLRQAVAGRVVMTDDAGEFVARDLALGDYSLMASIDGYTAVGWLQSAIDPGQALSLSAARPDGSATFKLLRVGSIYGVVTDDANVPLASVCLRIWHHVFSGSALVWQPLPVNTFTDPSGRFGFVNAPPGDYIVGVHYRSSSVPASVSDALWKPEAKPVADTIRTRMGDSNAFLLRTPMPPVSGVARDVDGYRWTIHDAIDRVAPIRADADPGGLASRTTYHPAAATFKEATVLSLGAGEERRDVNIRVRRTAGVRVSGTLVGDADQVAYVGLRLMPAGEQDVWQSFPGDVASTVTDAQGRFAFFAVPPGRVYLDSVISSSTPVAGPVPQLVRRSPVAWVRLPLDVEQADIADLKIPVRRLVKVQGRVEYQPTGIGPSDFRPTPASVQLAPVDLGRSAPRTTSPAPAEFVIDGVTPGRYLLSMPPSGNWVARSITVAGKETIHRAIEITNADIENVVVTMVTGVNRVTGVAMDRNGLGLEGAQVVMFPADYRGWFEGGRSTLAARSVVAGARGAYSISIPADGDYLIVAFAENVGRDWEDLPALAAIAPLAQAVRLEVGKAVVVDLKGALSEIPRRR